MIFSSFIIIFLSYSSTILRLYFYKEKKKKKKPNGRYTLFVYWNKILVVKTSNNRETRVNNVIFNENRYLYSYWKNNWSV